MKTNGYVAADGLPQDASASMLAEDIVRRSGAGPGYTVKVVPISGGGQPRAKVIMSDRIPAGSNALAEQRQDWDETVIVGDIAEAFIDRDLPPVGWAQTGSGRDISGSTIDAVAGQRFSNATTAAIVAHVRSVLAHYPDLKLVSVNVLRAGQPAPAVVVQTANPVRASKDAADVIGGLFGRSTGRYEADFYEMESTDGQPVIVTYGTCRGVQGSQWVSPRYPTVQYPFPHG